MKQLLLPLGILLLLVTGVWYATSRPVTNQVKRLPQITTQITPTPIPAFAGKTVIAENLDTPWSLVFLPDNSLLVTERKGTVRRVGADGVLDPQPVATLSGVEEIGEGGLLGIALHPEFAENNYVYLYYTYSQTGGTTLNRVVRMSYTDGRLTGEQTILDRIPGAPNHNGGRIKFGPDDNLYITTGDAQEPSLAQDRNSLAGKILRVTDSGSVPSDNPFGSPVYSYGHRNPQGLAWDNEGNLWSTEHGPSGIQSGNDEVNKVTVGVNYGWPTIQGTQTQDGLRAPDATSGRTDTWAPGGAAILGDTLFFTGLRGQALYSARISDTSLAVVAHLASQYGRIRDVVVGPDSMLYLTTSNRDGRGSPDATDDKILRIDPIDL